jgi:hypothetical protein
MAVHDNRSLTLERRSSDRSHGVSLAPVGQRLVNFLRGPKEQDTAALEEPVDFAPGEQWPEREEVLPRFPLARHGYHCAAVDEYVIELERELAEVDRELAEVRAYSVPRDEVSDQIKRVGEQTSAVLIAANEQRDEILRAAREEADRQVAEATARATLITAEGEARLRELHTQHESAARERDRLLDEVRSVSTALAALADSGQASTASSQHEQQPTVPADSSPA